LALAEVVDWGVSAQELAPGPRLEQASASAPPVAFTPPTPGPCDHPLPINLPTALHLANVRTIDVAVASERIRLAAAQLDRARVLWLPTCVAGVDYFRHDGRIQDITGNIIDTSKDAFMVGAGPTAVFAVTDALFAPLAARQVVRAREADLQTATNDSMLAVAEAYFNVQQARGELAGAIAAVRDAENLVYRTSKLAQGYIAPVEATRARVELDRLRQTVSRAWERWRVASADLARLLRLDSDVLVEPLEPPHLVVPLVALDQPVNDLIATALTNRPELAAQQALVQATLQRLRQERFRPLIPSVLMRGASTNPAGTLGVGMAGGGINDVMGRFGSRFDWDVQVLWEWQNLGFGNRARVRESQSEHDLSVLELLRIQDRVAAEVVQAFSVARSAAERMEMAQRELKNAVESVEQNLKGLGQTKRLEGNLLILIIRPQEVVAAIEALSQAYNDYYGAVADYNRNQFRLHRALGRPAQALAEQGADCAGPSADPITPGPYQREQVHDAGDPYLPDQRGPPHEGPRR
jgi:outer membrane protein TolC